MHYTRTPTAPATARPPSADTGDWAHWAQITVDTLGDPLARLSARLRAAEQLRLVARVAGSTGELMVRVHGQDATIRRRREGER
jgi:hypothetical protein